MAVCCVDALSCFRTAQVQLPRKRRTPHFVCRPRCVDAHSMSTTLVAPPPMMRFCEYTHFWRETAVMALLHVACHCHFPCHCHPFVSLFSTTPSLPPIPRMTFHRIVCNRRLRHRTTVKSHRPIPPITMSPLIATTTSNCRTRKTTVSLRTTTNTKRRPSTMKRRGPHKVDLV